MKKSILKTIGVAAMAALFCVTCGDNGLERSSSNNGDVDGFLDRIHGTPDTAGGGGNPVVVPPNNGGGTPTTPVTYTLTAGRNIANGGSVSRNPDKPAGYNPGENVTVTATPQTGFGFTGWTGAVTGTANPVTIKMDGNKTLTANFAWQDTTSPPPDTTYELIVSASPPSGGSVSLDPDQSDYNKGAQVTATATANTGYRFTKWSDASTSTSAEVTITMDGSKKLTANFEAIDSCAANPKPAGCTPTTTPTYYTLTVTRDPTAGGTTSPASLQSNIAAGTAVNISATAASGYTFAGWTLTTGTATFANASSASTTVTLSSNAAINAKFNTQQTTDPCATNPNAAECTSNQPTTGNTFTDTRDGEIYKKVTIGTQTWMARNLNYKIPDANTDLLPHQQITSVCYENLPSNCTKYGRLYTWEAAKIACPTGWHLPDTTEWAKLFTFAGATAGNKLKANSGWNNNGNGTDDYGFSALPGGVRNYYGFQDDGVEGHWWSADEYSEPYNASSRSLHSGSGYVEYYPFGMADHISVRCIENAGTQPPTTTTYTLTVGRNQTTYGNVTVKVGTGIAQSNPTVQSVTSGTSVTITATPIIGYTFVNWTTATGTSLPMGITATYTSNTFTMNGNVNITANFQAVATTTSYTLTTSVSPTGSGSISRNPTGTNYEVGATVSLTATPVACYAFSNWSGDLSGSTSPATITMNANRSVTAVFTNISNIIKNPIFNSIEDNFDEDGEINGAAWRVLSWTEELDYAPPTVTYSVSSGTLTATVSNATGEAANAQVVQEGVALISGKSYRLVFTARASASRIIYAIIQRNGLEDENWADYLSKSVSLTTTNTTFTYNFTQSATTDIARLAFNFGNVSGTVYISNVSLVESSCQ